MSVRKEDVYKLVEKMNDKETKLAYKLLKNMIHEQTDLKKIAEADNTPLNKEERDELTEIIKEDTVDWEDVKRELDL